jgi:hypothetical protein
MGQKNIVRLSSLSRFAVRGAAYSLLPPFQIVIQCALRHLPFAVCFERTR